VSITSPPIRKIEPTAAGWRNVTWAGGSFDTGHRTYTPAVEGTIRLPDHLVLVTLRGGAKQLEVRAQGSHHFVGPDRPGAVSFVPAHCERRLAMTGVAAAWASIAFPPNLFERDNIGEAAEINIAPFSNVEDPFIAGLVAEFERLDAADGGLDPTYCDVMARSLACHLAHRYGGAPAAARPWKLPPWRMRRIADYVDGHLGHAILIADLAALVGLSAGHLHRAFRATVGVTPLDFINERRVRRAMDILAHESVSVAALALRVGFVSPSHFTRTFRRVTGRNPSRFRAEIEPIPPEGRIDRR
jgi:AraC family transcriptional regulator